MKRNLKFLCAAMAASSIMLSACGTMPGGTFGNTSAGQGQSQSQGTLGSLLGTLLGNALPVSEAAVAGTWQYSSPEVRFESESLLTQAGGELAASQIESKLADYYGKMGIKPGACSFTFGKDKHCSIQIGARTISGTYSIDSNSHAFNFRSTTGLISLNGKIYNAGTSLALLFDAKKLLSIAQTLSAFTGQGSSTLSALSGLLDQYDGMMLGMNLSR